ncbi:MAG: hypothetical protein R3C44_18255 [Chloroflexota bacterium]
MGWLAAVGGALLGFLLIWLLTGFHAPLGSIDSRADWCRSRRTGLLEFPAGCQAAGYLRHVRKAARITRFSWHDVTLMLANAALAEHVVELNTPNRLSLLMG